MTVTTEPMTGPTAARAGGTGGVPAQRRTHPAPVSREALALLRQAADCLADARDVAVTEDADRAAEERLDVAIALDTLGS